MSSSISSSMIPESSASEQSRMELQARLTGLGDIGGRKLDPETKAKKLREACEGFESIFIQKMWQEMRNTVPKSGLLSGREEKFWQDMYDQELSKSMTSAGGIGLADMMYQQLSRGLANASSIAANAATGQGFVPSAAPLVTHVEESIATAQPANAPEPVKTVAAIYDGEAPDSSVPMGEVESRPDVPPAARKQNLRHADTFTRQPGSGESTTPLSSGLNQAYLAHREAGDKLGSNAVRPALRPQRKRAQRQETAEKANPAPQTFAPGSAQSLSAALELAKNGAGIQPAGQAGSLSEMVNAAKARNSLQASLNAQAAAAVAQTGQNEASQPVVRKVTYTTNIPKTGKNNKKNNAIRLLNVDNVGVNSKQGQGLAEWHAQQAQMADANQSTGQQGQNMSTHPGGQNLQAPPATAPIRPLTANDVQQPQNDANFAIPPLRVTDIKG